MINLSKDIHIPELVKTANIAELYEKDDLDKIGDTCFEEFEMDRRGRVDWERRMIPALAAAMQISKKKSFPWDGASSVVFPLVSIASLQYHTRVYHALLQNNDLVRLMSFGEDPDGMKTDRASRIAAHMNYQLLEEDEDWESEMDLTLLVQSIVGCAFKKIYYAFSDKIIKSCFVSPFDLVVPFYTKNINKAVRISHILSMTKNDLYEREMQGLYLPCEKSDVNKGPRLVSPASFAREGEKTSYDEDKDAPYDIIEQHRWLDLDNDGYSEPYVVTFRHDTKKVLRVVARYYNNDIDYTSKKEVVRIRARNSFIKYPFIPSPDGSFYDMGFGSLLSSLSGSVDSIINQLIDSGTLSNLGGGFISRNLVLRSGNYRFTPGEYKIVDATGAQLSEGILPLPIREPSETLFKLLELLINYGERVAGSTDSLLGQNPGQNTPAESFQSLLDQGSRIFQGLFRRTYSSFRRELRLIFELNSLTLTVQKSFMAMGSGQLLQIHPQDYLNYDGVVGPASDVMMYSDRAQLEQAQALLQASKDGTGFDMYQIYKRFLRALRITNIDEILPDPSIKPQQKPQPDPSIQVAMIKEQGLMQRSQMDNRIKLLHEMHQRMIAEGRLLSAEARSVMQLSKADETGDVPEYIATINQLKEQNQALFSQLDQLLKGTVQEQHNVRQERSEPVAT